jgi:hypothetical protein
MKQYSDWAPAKDPVSGDTYYYHRQTKQTTWDPPLGKNLVSRDIATEEKNIIT